LPKVLGFNQEKIVSQVGRRGKVTDLGKCLPSIPAPRKHSGVNAVENFSDQSGAKCVNTKAYMYGGLKIKPRGGRKKTRETSVSGKGGL